MHPMSEYRAKLRSAAEAVSVIKSGDWVDYGMTLSQPMLLDEALAKRKGELTDVKIRGTLAVAPRQVVETDPHRDAFTYCCWHFGGYERKLQERN